MINYLYNVNIIKERKKLNYSIKKNKNRKKKFVVAILTIILIKTTN